MAEWLFEIDLSPVWKKANDEVNETWMVPVWFLEIITQKFTALLPLIRETLPPGIDRNSICDEIQFLLDEIQLRKTDEGIPKEEFDEIWKAIYDIADKELSYPHKNLLWVKTVV